MSVTDIATLLLALGSFLGAMFAIREVKWKNKQREASTAEQFEKMLSRTIKEYEEELALTKQYRKKIDQLETELEEVIAIVEEWDKGIKALICQLELNEISPTWRPKKHYERKSAEI